MQSFLEEVVDEVWQKYNTIEDVVFVLPSKRAGTFLKNSIVQKTDKTLFAPEIYSIESFVESISGLAYASNTQQLFELYSTYLKTAQGEKDNFHVFSKWGQTLLQDFNEIDRYLVEPAKIFSYLSAIQEINHWYLQSEKTKMMEDYILFWNNLEQLYSSFNTNLLKKGLGHQGLVYRQACARLDTYLKTYGKKHHVFVGFNAVNKAESHIIQEFLSTTNASIYWDSDPYFIDDPIHDAGFFIRQHKSTWDSLNNMPLNGVKENYHSKKNIQIIGVPKNISQAKYVGNLLKEWFVNDKNLLQNTAVVLGDETLLNPLLNSVPLELKGVNITMGYPLNKTPLASLFLQLFDLHINREPQGWLYRSVLSFLSHPNIQILLTQDTKNYAAIISEEIKIKNYVYVSQEKIRSLSKDNAHIALLFNTKELLPLAFIENCLQIILELKEKYSEINNTLALEYLYRFYTLFNQLKEILEKYPFVNDLKSLLSLFKELLSSETLDFKGEPLKGLQIMGMLESRNLDFETVIITSVNEGILPSGKSNNSFIPYDVKKSFGLPTYKEKDAVYTYHFYRLLQRAKNVYILYNTEPDVLEGGEKSRLITQLLTDENKLADITQIIASPKVIPGSKELETISKDADLMKSIKNLAAKGFSPTSLTNYIRNPIDFYKRSILKIDDVLAVEETVAANTFGTIVHDTLEELYLPLVNTYLTPDSLIDLKRGISKLVKSHFAKNYSEGDITRGKNLIALHVVERYVENFINLEIEQVKKHQIKILGLEESLQVQLNFTEIDFPIILKGKLDRIDEKDGVIRIIDYKTGKVTSTQVELVNWDEIGTDFDLSKAFQLLCYAYLYGQKHSVKTMEAGIISFKNLNAGLLQFATKDKKGSRKKHFPIDQEVLNRFHAELKQLILEICNPEIPFTQKEV